MSIFMYTTHQVNILVYLVFGFTYNPPDLAATVSYPDCNFIVRNDNPYKLLITTNCSDDDTLTVNIYKMDRVII